MIHESPVARGARLKPRLGPTAEAASIGPFTGRCRAASSLALLGHAYAVIERPLEAQ